MPLKRTFVKWRVNDMKEFMGAIGIAIVVAAIACFPETPVSTSGPSDLASVEPTATKLEPTPIEKGTRLRGAFALEGKKFQHGRTGEACQGYDKSRDIGPWLLVRVYDSTFKIIDKVKLQAGITNGSQCLLHWESNITPSYRYRVCLWDCVKFEAGGLDSGWIDTRALEEFDYSVQWIIKSDYNISGERTLPNIMR